MNKFACIEVENLENVNGGGLAGAFVGAVFGTGGGLVAGAIAAAASGNSKDAGHIIWSTTKKGLTSGAITGFFSPM